VCGCVAGCGGASDVWLYFHYDRVEDIYICLWLLNEHASDTFYC
jgi:hypothetical protein